jgi:hypothetical protein
LNDPRNPVEIAAAIKTTLPPVARGEYADKGRGLAQQLSWDETAEVLLQALQMSVKEKQANGRPCPGLITGQPGAIFSTAPVFAGAG